MKKNFPCLCCWVIIIIVLNSCSKDKVKPTITPLTMGLYQYGTDKGKRVFIPITQIGTQAVDYFSVFDTGSTGMTIDAHGIIPASMITTSGITFTGDSVVVSGITITSQQAIMSYGNQTGLIKEYGYLAYASVTIGDQNGKTSAKRVPFFLYYKVVDETTGETDTVNHSLDIFGVGPGTSYASSLIASPLTYFNIDASLTSGFRLAMLQSNSFSSTGTYVAGLLSIGLTSSDLTSSGFVMHQLSNPGVGGFSPNIPSTVTYSGQSVSTNVLFDTGTPQISTIENPLATNSLGQLPANTVVTIKTYAGFTYTYTTTNTSNLTEIQNPNVTGDYRTIFGIDFFVKNEYLTDYAHHKIGLKNN
ncbi:hypothetical protein ACPPVU_03950 [Mucilaginibacter sp. McL0603]|uniref:hypothetical protein n=1 Tax=Mucilaginibacter sp. McL0603 TaxID=3415670 RepID=UPI003CE68CE5